jgi:hypothetical protein
MEHEEQIKEAINSGEIKFSQPDGALAARCSSFAS